MLGTRHQLAIAGAVAAVLLGVLLHGVEATPDSGAEISGRRASAAVVDSAPVGVAPAAVRSRSWVERELSSIAQSSRVRLGGLALALVLGLVPVATAWWCLSRPDRRLAAPLQRSSLAALRAPPTTALA